jgi:ATP-dependent Clp protease adaptor protein ClpS
MMCPVRGDATITLNMTATKIKKDERTRTGNKTKRELPWSVILHNDWENSMPRVVIILKKVIPGMTLAKATAIMYQAHTSGQALVKSCHRELAELYEERLQAEGLTVSIEPAG